MEEKSNPSFDVNPEFEPHATSCNSTNLYDQEESKEKSSSSK